MTIAGKRYVDCSVLGTESTADGEDSSYDSDYETEETIGSNGGDGDGLYPQLVPRVPSVSSSNHIEVSRTTSDTLAAEFAEYVTVQQPPLAHTPGYMARVEFALKLGYTERLVQTALEKLGPDPGQNELLAELIKLGATSPQLYDDTRDSESSLAANSADGDGGSVDESGGGVGGGGDGGVGGGGGGESTEAGGCAVGGGLRPVVIDGSNVAMSHGNKEVFSCRGIKIAVDWFQSRGHKEITVFVPKWRKEASRLDNPIADQEILGELERDRLLVFTPSRLVGGKRLVCYDDRYILRLAAEVDGIVVSNDHYRDLAQENPEFRRVVEERILMYSFVNDRFMPPDDPLGRSGPTLDNFLRVGQARAETGPLCPYAKKCTYGNKCKFRHPERGSHPQKTVTERLVEHAQRHLQARAPSLSLPLPGSAWVQASQQQQQQQQQQQHPYHRPLCKSRSATSADTAESTASLSAIGAGRRPLSTGQTQHALFPRTRYKPGEGEESRLEQAFAGTTGQLASGREARATHPLSETVRPHRKLQRQLTLNPAHDARLFGLQQRNAHKSSSTLQCSGSVNFQQTLCKQNASEEGTSKQAMPQEPSRRGNDSGWKTATTGNLLDESSPLLEELAARVSNIRTIEDTGFVFPDPKMKWILNPLLATWDKYSLKLLYDTRAEMYAYLIKIFPENDVKVEMLLHPFETDEGVILAKLSRQRKINRQRADR